jgi:hypothetical protein
MVMFENFSLLGALNTQYQSIATSAARSETKSRRMGWNRLVAVLSKYQDISLSFSYWRPEGQGFMSTQVLILDWYAI